MISFKRQNKYKNICQKDRRKEGRGGSNCNSIGTGSLE
jgi:hypothetical protein